MKLSESLRRNIFDSGVGGIINKFKVKSRRSTLFFEDILAEYVRTSEQKGHKNNMRAIGEKWCALSVSALTPQVIRRLPPAVFFNIMSHVWNNVGILENISFERKNEFAILTVKNNTITRIIGETDFVIGCFIGILKAVLNADIKYCNTTKISASEEEYVFEIRGKKICEIAHKRKELYDHLNIVAECSGFTLKDAIRKNIFQLKNNRIYFRGMSIIDSENTLFHIIGNNNILMGDVPKIAHNYFKKLVESAVEPEKKLMLLKTLLQTMGWGIITISKNGSEIKLNIKNPPYGLQTEKDNWIFLINVVLGYLWLINKNLKLSKIKKNSKSLVILYTSH